MTLLHPLEAQCRLDTPLGPMTLAATPRGLAGAWFDGQAHHPGPLAAPVDPAQHWLQEAARQLTAYFSGSLRHFNLPLDAAGTAWQQAVWHELLAIAPGRTSGYGAIAQALGKPQAARAVGAAVGRNPVSVIVPCHRVLGRDGSLTGYAGGLERKRALLALEGAQQPLVAAA
jgi:methylated-DNA-[protein]-cysteine S-methyltransferase